MPNYSISDAINYSNKSFILQLADSTLTLFRIAFKKSEVDARNSEQVTTSIKTTHLALRILAGLFTVLILPFNLMALSIKWWKRKEWQQAVSVQIPSKRADISNIKISIPTQQEEFIPFLIKQLEVSQPLDCKLPPPQPGSWRDHGSKHHEHNQTLSQYIETPYQTWPDVRPLHIQCIGTFSETDLKIINITCDYLSIFHQIPIKLEKTILTMEALKELYLRNPENLAEYDENVQWVAEYMHKRLQQQLGDSYPRTNGQYNADTILDLMQRVLLPPIKENSQDEPQLIAYTNQDLFASEMSNFVFGSASLSAGVGIWSNARLGNPHMDSQSFQQTLLRTMKISAHEFGHMRGFPHCTDYECNIAGYMSAKELDGCPLLYCLQDTAKICYLTHTDLLTYHKKLLDFFESFNQHYQLNCDFTREIHTLKKRIHVLAEASTNQVKTRIA